MDFGRSAASASATGGCRSSICRRPARSRWRAPTARSSSRSTARSTTTASCAATWRRRAACSAASPTPKSCCISTPRRARRWCTTCAACLPSRSGTRERGALFLARDPYGIKPLYYRDDGWTFRFASQVKALLAGGAVSRDPEPAGMVGFYLLGSVPEPFTTYRAIRALAGRAHADWSTAIGAHEPQRYHSIAAVYCRGASAHRAAARPPRAARRVREALLDSVRHHLVADVPVGAFLSAGIDSGALVGLMRDAGPERHPDRHAGLRGVPRHATTTRRRSPTEVARIYGTRHTTRVVTQAEFEADLPRILEAMDQPSIDGINTWFVSKAARERGLKVAISGLGGDELFGGYPSFRDIPRWVRRLALPVARPAARAGSSRRAAARPALARLALQPEGRRACSNTAAAYAGAYLLAPRPVHALGARQAARSRHRRARACGARAAARRSKRR